MTSPARCALRRPRIFEAQGADAQVFKTALHNGAYATVEHLVRVTASFFSRFKSREAVASTNWSFLRVYLLKLLNQFLCFRHLRGGHTHFYDRTIL